VGSDFALTVVTLENRSVKSLLRKSLKRKMDTKFFVVSVVSDGDS